MNKIKIFVASFLISSLAFTQQLPTGNDGSSPDWKRGGNTPFGGVPSNANIFGTFWNSPIYTYTAGVPATKLNGTVSYAVNGFTNPKNGYFLLGINGFLNGGGQALYQNKGAFSLLHLNGSSQVQELGFRPWMKTGITFTDNQDLSYIGLRQVGGVIDLTETVIAWSDNI